jgi:hypothetical protein
LIVAAIFVVVVFLVRRDRDGFRNDLENFSSRLRQSPMGMPVPEIDLVALLRWLIPLVFFFLGGLLLLRPGTPPLSPAFGVSLLGVGAVAAAGCLAIGFLLRHPR